MIHTHKSMNHVRDERVPMRAGQVQAREVGRPQIGLLEAFADVGARNQTGRDSSGIRSYHAC